MQSTREHTETLLYFVLQNTNKTLLSRAIHTLRITQDLFEICGFQSDNHSSLIYPFRFVLQSIEGLKEKPLHSAAIYTLQQGVWLLPRIDWVISCIHSVVQ
jgi:hypothetical protein